MAIQACGCLIHVVCLLLLHDILVLCHACPEKHYYDSVQAICRPCSGICTGKLFTPECLQYKACQEFHKVSHYENGEKDRPIHVKQVGDIAEKTLDNQNSDKSATENQSTSSWTIAIVISGSAIAVLVTGLAVLALYHNRQKHHSTINKTPIYRPAKQRDTATCTQDADLHLSIEESGQL